MSKKVNELTTPCFLVDIDKLKENSERMIQTCKRLDVNLRPHTKTHKTLEGAEIQTNGTKRSLAVSTLVEAEMYANNGFDDILLAHPITKDKIPRCLKLLKQLEKFHVMASGIEGIECLEQHAAELPASKVWSVVLEVDTGYGRTGFRWDASSLVDAAQRLIQSKTMRLESVYCHCGNSYDVNSKEKRSEVQNSVVERLTSVKSKLADFGKKVPVGTGSTPSCSLALDINMELDEFHPGNYVFYDYEQYLLNACTQSNIACRVMTRVIAHKQELDMILVDCGFLALGHDGMHIRPDDFCVIQGESNLKVVGMTQEIGKIKAKEGELDCSMYPVGSILYIYPFHSCATAAMHQVYQVHSGDDVVATWIPVKGW